MLSLGHELDNTDPSVLRRASVTTSAPPGGTSVAPRDVTPAAKRQEEAAPLPPTVASPSEPEGSVENAEGLAAACRRRAAPPVAASCTVSAVRHSGICVYVTARAVRRAADTARRCPADIGRSPSSARGSTEWLRRVVQADGRHGLPARRFSARRGAADRAPGCGRRMAQAGRRRGSGLTEARDARRAQGGISHADAQPAPGEEPRLAAPRCRAAGQTQRATRLCGGSTRRARG